MHDAVHGFSPYTFKAMYLKGITTTTRTIRCTSCGRSHEDWKSQSGTTSGNVKNTSQNGRVNQTDERDNNSRRERKNPRVYEVAEGIRMIMDGVSTRKSDIYSLTLSGICSISSSRSSLNVSFALDCNSGLQVRGTEPAGTPELPLRRHSASCVPA